MNVDFHEMEQGASIRRRQNQAAPDKGGWSAFFGLVDRSLPNNASCSRCPLSTSHGTPASSRALRMIDEILFCGAARFALEPRAIGEPPSCQAAPTVSHPPIIIGGGRGFDNHGPAFHRHSATRLSKHDSRILQFLNEFCLSDVRSTIDTKRAAERKLARLRRLEGA